MLVEQSAVPSVAGVPWAGLVVPWAELVEQLVAPWGVLWVPPVELSVRLSEAVLARAVSAGREPVSALAQWDQQPLRPCRPGPVRCQGRVWEQAACPRSRYRRRWRLAATERDAMGGRERA